MIFTLVIKYYFFGIKGLTMQYRMLDKNIKHDTNGPEFTAFFINDLEEYFSCSINLDDHRIKCFKDTQEAGFTPIHCPNDLKNILIKQAEELVHSHSVPAL